MLPDSIFPPFELLDCETVKIRVGSTLNIGYVWVVFAFLHEVSTCSRFKKRESRRVLKWIALGV